jgi:soluble lytic murein transglycosylase-like protein
MVLTTTVKPVPVKSSNLEPQSIHRDSDSLQEYIDTLCKKSCVRANHLNKIVTQASHKYNVPVDLILAVLKVESGFKHKAKSKGNYGLMQINHRSHPNVKLKQIFNIDNNINVGTSILSKCLDSNNQNISKALSCYKGDKSLKYIKDVKKARLIFLWLA